MVFRLTSRLPVCKRPQAIHLLIFNQCLCTLLPLSLDYKWSTPSHQSEFSSFPKRYEEPRTAAVAGETLPLWLQHVVLSRFTHCCVVVLSRCGHSKTEKSNISILTGHILFKGIRINCCQTEGNSSWSICCMCIFVTFMFSCFVCNVITTTTTTNRSF